MVIDKNLSTWIKFGAAIVVVLHHYSQYVYANDLSCNIIYKLFSSQGGYLAVAVFFFLSGYGLNESEKYKHLSFFSFLKKRWLKIYIPTLFVTALWIPIEVLFKGPNIIGGGKSLIYKLFIGFDDGVLWFLKVLCILYFAFAIYAYIKNRFSQQYANVCIYLLTIAIVVIVWWAFPSFCAISVPMFVLGVMGSNCGDKVSSFAQFLLNVFAWGTFMCVYFFFYGGKAMCLQTIINYLFIGITLFVLYKTPIRLKSKPRLLFASISFDLYLVHGKVLDILKCTIANITLVDYIAYTLIVVSTFYMLRVKLKL